MNALATRLSAVFRPSRSGADQSPPDFCAETDVGTECKAVLPGISRSGADAGAEQLPCVTVVIPIRNESGFIAECVQSILANQYPTDRLEVLVVDGLSDDGTREIIRKMMTSDPRIHLLDNPEKTVPYAMNRAIAASCGDIIIRVDGHAEVAPDFVVNSVKVLLQRPECWCAGGAIETVNDTLTGQVIAAAMSSPVGVGNARFRLGDYEGYVDTIAFGAYWRWVFDRIGNFDEELVRNQDDELNARLIFGGGRIYLSRSIRSTYYSRTSLRKLWKQYYQYGFWRIRTIQKLGRPATVRQMIPLLFVAGLLVLTAAALPWAPARTLLAGSLAVYGLGIMAGTLQVCRRTGIRGLPIAPIVFLILHFAYGFGSLWGLVWFTLLGRRGAQHAMSR